MAWAKVLAKCRWKHPHLLGIRDLSRDELLSTLQLSRALKRNPPTEAPLKGTRLLTFFAEASTRTKTSFAIAARRLGVEVVDLSPGSSSLTKGESLKDTTRTIEAMGVDFAVVRHPASGAPHYISKALRASVMNAGDGTNEHPTQALLDLFTMEERLGRATDLKVALVGDILHSRVARSHIWMHRLLGNKVTLVGPATLIPKGIEDLGVEVTHNLDPVLETHDVIIMLRLQLERQASGLFPSTREYSQLFGLTRDRLHWLKRDAIIMHPGPMNRGWEISAEAADHKQSAILDQVANGVTTRMAILLLLDSAK